ncbi:MAG TPA: hypothetical protein ENH85_00565, partial [Candidatus Scalindua sp.]|nr:hypothetical protein [Candidatus Scalindua sp.]
MEVITRQNVFSFIQTEETNYQTLPINVSEGYDWNMAQHIKLSLLYKMSQYETGKTDDKPFKNIIRPILNLQYRAEGFDVKDIVLFVNSAKEYYKSFLVKKYHEKWARENNIDTFIDDMVESYVDFGGALIKNINDKKPEVIQLQGLAFCDQTNILSGPICLKHFYAPDQLKEMEKKGWKNIDELIILAQESKDTDQTRKQIKTPGKYVKVYELHGVLPDWWLDEEKDNGEYTRQMHVVAFYQTRDNKSEAISLYKGKEGESIFKFISRDKIFGRALGFGGAEELFEPQVWTN